MINPVFFFVILFVATGSKASIPDSLEDYLGNTFIPRSKWDPNPVHMQKFDSDPNKTLVSIHHTAGRSPDSYEEQEFVMRGIKEFHTQSKKFTDIGFHYGVSATGNVFEARPLDALGSHTKGLNKGNIGVSFFGCFDNRTEGCSGNHVLTEKMLNSTIHLLVWLGSKKNISITDETVVARSQYDVKMTGKTSFPYSPGNKVIEILPTLIKDAQNLLK